MPLSHRITRQAQNIRAKITRNRNLGILGIAWLLIYPYVIFVAFVGQVSVLPYGLSMFALLLWFILPSAVWLLRSKITNEERMLCQIDSASLLLEKYGYKHDNRYLVQCAKEIRKAKSHAHATPSSSFRDEYDDRFAAALDGIAVTVDEKQDVDAAQDLLQSLTEFLLKPTLDEAKIFFDQAASLPHKERLTLRLWLRQITQKLPGQIAMSVGLSLIAVSALTVGGAALFKYDPYAIVSSHAFEFIGLLVVCFCAILGSMQVKR